MKKKANLKPNKAKKAVELNHISYESNEIDCEEKVSNSYMFFWLHTQMQYGYCIVMYLNIRQ